MPDQKFPSIVNIEFAPLAVGFCAHPKGQPLFFANGDTEHQAVDALIRKIENHDSLVDLMRGADLVEESNQEQSSSTTRMSEGFRRLDQERRQREDQLEQQRQDQRQQQLDDQALAMMHQRDEELDEILRIQREEEQRVELSQELDLQQTLEQDLQQNIINNINSEIERDIVLGLNRTSSPAQQRESALLDMDREDAQRRRTEQRNRRERQEYLDSLREANRRHDLEGNLDDWGR